jgi:hypothetical protein
MIIMIDPVRFSGALKVDIFLLTPTNNIIYEVKLQKFIQLFLLITLVSAVPCCGIAAGQISDMHILFLVYLTL